MKKNNSNKAAPMILKLWKYIGQQRRNQIYILLFLSVISSLLEMMTIGAFIPFVSMIASNKNLPSISVIESIYKFIELYYSVEKNIFIALAFCIISVISSAVKFFLLWCQTKISFSIGADLSVDIYRRTLYDSYESHISRNSSEVISAIRVKTNNIVSSCILPLLTITTSAIILIMVFMMLVGLNKEVAVGVVLTISIIYAVLLKITKKKLRENGVKVNKLTVDVLKALNEGIGGVRDVIINNTQEFYIRTYIGADGPLRESEASIQVISGGPKYFIEALGILILTCFALKLSETQADNSLVLPVVAAMALGAQRLLPLAQQGYASWSLVSGALPTLEAIIKLLDMPENSHHNIENKVVEFNNKIEMRNITYSYLNTKAQVLKGINLTIKKGDRIGILGKTGGGKSTLIDVFIGLLKPTNGKIFIDEEEIIVYSNKNWHSKISIVPQHIHLIDATVAENIAIGIEKENIDMEKVKEAANAANINEVIMNLNAHYDTIIGENGIILSGGQRQRIGIARALYKDSEILIFDEATSALDGETEAAVMDSIYKLDNKKTLIMITHRKTTLRHCNKVYHLQNGYLTTELIEL